MTYTIKEESLNGDDANLFEVPSTTYTVTVKPSADGEGFDITYTKDSTSGVALAAEAASLLAKPLALAAYDAGIMPIATINGSAAFVNTYKDVKTSIALDAKKQLDDGAGKTSYPPENEYSFTAKLSKVELEDLVNGCTYRFDGENWTADPTEKTVPDDIQKLFQFAGDGTTSGGATGSDTQTVKNGANGVITFNMLHGSTNQMNLGGLTLTSLEYTVEEPKDNYTDTVYNRDTKVYTVSYKLDGTTLTKDKVTYVTSPGSGDPTTPANDTVLFTNTYAEKTLNFTLNAVKQLKDSSNGTNIPSNVVTNANGKFTFTATPYSIQLNNGNTIKSGDTGFEDYNIPNIADAKNGAFNTDTLTRTISFEEKSYDVHAHTDVKSFVYKIEESSIDSGAPFEEQNETLAYYALVTVPAESDTSGNFTVAYYSDVDGNGNVDNAKPVDTNNVVFTNIYRSNPQPVTFNAEKYYKLGTDGDETLLTNTSDKKDMVGQFNFTAGLYSITKDGIEYKGSVGDNQLTDPAVSDIYNAAKLGEGNSKTVQNGDDGKISFNATDQTYVVELDMNSLSFDKLVYKLAETKPTQRGWTVEQDTVYVIVTPKTDDTGVTGFNVTYSYSENGTASGENNNHFVNVYTASQGSVELKAEKYYQIGTNAAQKLDNGAVTSNEQLKDLLNAFQFSAKIVSITKDETKVTSGFDTSAVSAIYDALNITDTPTNGNDGSINFAKKDINDLNAFDFNTQIEIIYELSEDGWQDEGAKIPGWSTDKTNRYAKVTISYDPTGNKNMLGEVKYYDASAYNATEGTLSGDGSTALQHFTNTYTAKNANIAFEVAKTLDDEQVSQNLVDASAFTFTATLHDHQNGGIMVFDSTNKMVTPTPADFAEGSSLYTLTGTMSNENGRTNVKFAAQEGASIDANKYNDYTFVYTITEDNLQPAYASQYTKDNSTVYAVVKINSNTETYYSVDYYSAVSVNQTPIGNTLNLNDTDKIVGENLPFTFKNTTLISTSTTTFQFKKVDADGKTPLEGAEFMLYSDDACTTPLPKDTYCDPSVPDRATKCTYDPNVAHASAKDTGLVTYDYISYVPGTGKAAFYMRETKAAPGHELSPNTFKIEIGGNGAITLSYRAPGDSDWKNIDNIATEDGTYLFQITNNPSTHLPLAGGSGVAMFYIFGLAAVLIAAGGYGIYRKRLNLRAGAWEEIPPEK